MKVTIWFISVTAVAAMSVACVSGADDEKLLPMFNGRDLTGWVRTNTPEETWTVKDGMLICTGRPIGELRTDRMYENFILELEWRHMAPRGNAGVFVWADDITSRGVPFHRGIEVQVLENAYGDSKGHTTHGDIFPIHGATMTPINGRGGSRAFPTEKRSNPSPEWNHYRIVCRNGQISLAVNGKIVTQGKDCSPRKGYICLESEGGIVHYRNVRLQELPGSDVAVEHVAIANRGYRSVYSGLDFNGWKVGDGDKAWQSKNWVLAFAGAEDTNGLLTLEESIPHVGAVIDVKMKAKSSNAVLTVGPVTLDLGSSAIREHLESVGRWNRIEFITKDGQHHVKINGTVVMMSGDADKDGAVVLKATGQVDFSNIYVRSQKAAE